MEKVYVTTKEQCQSMIKGVCGGCGGDLEPLETVDNSGAPTFWVGCKQCMCFRAGVDRRYFEIARDLIKSRHIIPYRHLEEGKDEESKKFWLDSQCAGLSRDIALIHRLIEDKFNPPIPG